MTITEHSVESERHTPGYLACGASDLHWAMIRAVCNSVSRMAVYPLQDVLGLGSDQRMNTPGTLGCGNWSWRFDWPMLGSEPARVLALIAATSGRAPASGGGHACSGCSP